MKITISLPALISILHNAADALQVAHDNGLDTVTFKPGINLYEFLCFCLGAERITWK